MMRSSCRRSRTTTPRSCFRKVGRRSSRTCARSSRKNTDRCRPRRGGSAPQPGSRGDAVLDVALTHHPDTAATRSEEHTSELQSLMRISYAVFCLKKKKTLYKHTTRKM